MSNDVVREASKRPLDEGPVSAAKKQPLSAVTTDSSLPSSSTVTLPSPPCPVDAVCVNTVRCLAGALPLAAKSGHPGAPIGCAAIAHVLFSEVMKFAPSQPKWICRDRFVLSNGHACALLYTMLHLTGYPEMTLEQLQKFRQVHSLTPGHPECHHTAGVEVTTGPLGQGVAQAVGLAIAEQAMAARFERPGFEDMFSNYTYTIVGDGCLQEGVSAEAMSLAGHLKLGKLICFYDDNSITIDGATSLSFTEDVPARAASYGWQVLTVANANTDCDAIRAAIAEAKNETGKPSLIVCKTIIGFGAAKEGTAKVHGSPLSAEDLGNLRTKCGFAADDLWAIDAQAKEVFLNHGRKGDAMSAAWTAKFNAEYKAQHPEAAAEFERRVCGTVSEAALNALPVWAPSDKADATRNCSEKVLNAIAPHMPELIGGSADLMESNKTDIKCLTPFGSAEAASEGKVAQYIHFGVREHGMAAVCNGLAAYGGFKPFGATFLNFVTYAWGALRLSALSQLPTLMVATHDTIDLGEDGPTHQPIEVAALIRSTPGMLLIRPGDGNETSGAYKVWMQSTQRPVVLALSRGNCPQLPTTDADKVGKGGYVLEDFEDAADKKRVCLAGSGTELHRCVEAAKLLRADNFNVRVVSMPCWTLFDEQSEEYKLSVVPAKTTCVNSYSEAMSSFGWTKYFHEEVCLGMTTFGASGPAAHLLEHFKFTPQDLVNKVKAFAH